MPEPRGAPVLADRVRRLNKKRGSDDVFGQKVRRARMNLAVHLPHVASWAAFFTVVTWMFVPTK